LTESRLEAGLPVWRYEFRGHVVEKRVFMPHLQNTVYVTYHHVAGPGPVRLKVRPSVNFRGHEDPVSVVRSKAYTLTAVDGRYELSAGPALPVLRLRLDGDGTALTLDGVPRPDILYRIEESRGYEATGSLWSPGFFRANLRPGRAVALTASTEAWERLLALPAEAALAAERERRRRLLQAAVPAVHDAYGAELVMAADQFIIL